MKHPPRHAVALLALTVAGLLSVSERARADAPGAPLPAPATGEVIDRILAIVDDDVVTSSEVERRAKLLIREAEARVGADPKLRAAAARAVREEVLERIIDARAMQIEADELHMAITAEQIERAIESVGSSQGVSREELEKAVADAGMTMVEYREELRLQLLEASLVRVELVPKLPAGLEGTALNEAIARARPDWIGGLRAKIYVEKRP